MNDGKGKKDRTLWIETEDLGLPRQWRKVRDQLPESGFLFTTHDGKRPQDRYLRTMVKRLARQAGIDLVGFSLTFGTAISAFPIIRDLIEGILWNITLGIAAVSTDTGISWNVSDTPESSKRNCIDIVTSAVLILYIRFIRSALRANSAFHQ